MNRTWLAVVALAVVLTVGCSLLGKNPQEQIPGNTESGTETASSSGQNSAGGPTTGSGTGSSSGTGQGTSGDTGTSSTSGTSGGQSAPSTDHHEDTGDRHEDSSHSNDQYPTWEGDAWPKEVIFFMTCSDEPRAGVWAEWTGEETDEDGKKKQFDTSHHAFVAERNGHFILETRTYTLHYSGLPETPHKYFVVAYEVDNEGNVYDAWVGWPGTKGRKIEVMKKPEAQPVGDYKIPESDWEILQDFSSESITQAGRSLSCTKVSMTWRNKKTGETMYDRYVDWYTTEAIRPDTKTGQKEDGTKLGTLVRAEIEDKDGSKMVMFLCGYGEDAKPELEFP